MVEKVIRDYVKDNPLTSSDDLKDKFLKNKSKPIIKNVEPKQKSYYYQDPISLSDGDYYFTNQWASHLSGQQQINYEGSIEAFIDLAKKEGIEIEKMPS
jgi:hypothetical protein